MSVNIVDAAITTSSNNNSKSIDVCKGVGCLYFIKPLTTYAKSAVVITSIVFSINYKKGEISGSGSMKDNYMTQPFMISGSLLRVQNGTTECKFMMVTKYTKTEYNGTLKDNKMYLMSDIMHGVLDIECLI
jgi:hypothetical protein